MSDWTAGRTPADRMADMHARILEASHVYVEADMRARDAGRTRARTLDLMRDLRAQMRNLAAEHGLEIPFVRWGELLEREDG